MTELEYRTHPAVSRSELFNISESPEKFKYYKENPKEPTQAMVFGQLLHKMALQPETLYDEFAVSPVIDRRTKAGKTEWQQFLIENEGKTVVTPEMYDQSKAMCKSIFKNEFAVKLLSGEKETPYFWDDAETGEECKCRTDCTVKIGDINLIVDLKSTVNAETGAFMREAIRYGYDFQAGMYTAGVEAVTNETQGFVFIAVEKDPPYSVNVMQADKLFVERGRKLYRKYMDIYHDCNESGNWWGYMGKENAVNSLSLPAWLSKEEE